MDGKGVDDKEVEDGVDGKGVGVGVGGRGLDDVGGIDLVGDKVWDIGCFRFPTKKPSKEITPFVSVIRLASFFFFLGI